VRFNAQQAVLIDVALIFPSLIGEGGWNDLPDGAIHRATFLAAQLPFPNTAEKQQSSLQLLVPRNDAQAKIAIVQLLS